MYTIDREGVQNRMVLNTLQSMYIVDRGAQNRMELNTLCNQCIQ